MTEVWKIITKDYEVSSLGRVRRLSSRTNTWNGRIIKPSLSPKGYPRLSLSIDGIKFNRFVHTLVAQAFLGERPIGYEVNHKDGNKQNNTSSNLEYVTSTGNKEHASKLFLLAFGNRNGSRKYPERLMRGERINTARLKAEEVIAIRKLADNGLNHCQIAKQFPQISRRSICRIVNRQTWQHI